MKPPQWNPKTLLELSGSYWQTCTLHNAVKLGIFSIIDNGNPSADDIAVKLGANPRAMAMLLNALTGMGLLEKKDNLYSNTEAARQYLSKSSPQYIGFMIMHHHHLVDSFSRMSESIMSGKPNRSRISFEDEEYRESFLMGMFNNAMQMAPQITEKIDLSKHRHFLDLGGGPGTYAIFFCKKYPQLKATVFDLPTTQNFAQKTIERFSMQDRIKFIGGNFLEDTIEKNYDVVWLSQILHGDGIDDCQTIIDKAVGALKPGGKIIIHEFILNNTMSGPMFPTLFSLNMLLGTAKGQAYSDRQISQMLENANVTNISRIFLDSPNDSGIILGTVET